ncbi:MAG: hypothetical protein IJ480_11925 [Clostridia bacterium]|nr:hypothetical protein [Clostridia bacterium]
MKKADSVSASAVQDSFYIIPRSAPAVRLSLLLMSAAGLIRILYFCLTPLTAYLFWIHLLLPLTAVILFPVTVLCFGETRPQRTAVSVFLGVVFFLLKSFTFTAVLHTVLCILLYMTVLVLYTLTICGVIRTKILLYPLFGLPLLYHIFVEDMRLYVFADPPVPFPEWLPEISVLCIMASLLSLSVGIRKRKP